MLGLEGVRQLHSPHFPDEHSIVFVWVFPFSVQLQVHLVAPAAAAAVESIPCGAAG
jgi:hypothetical protein